ncbi:MAG: hypothetical protein HQL34_09725 [Alphaproteobacteria bacterium]|nr:hypothetical protein [Alphaproteobacteria bacterium]
MTTSAPELAALTRRLAECPAEFLLPPRTEEEEGLVHVDAVVADLMRVMNARPPSERQAARLREGTADRLGLVLVGAWLLSDPWFVARGVDLGARILNLLCNHFEDLSHLVKARDCVADPDRREELARLCLKHLDLRPDGESEREAEDRLTSVDSVAQRKVAIEAAKAERRAQVLREKMARKKAREAASVYGRE